MARPTSTAQPAAVSYTNTSEQLQWACMCSAHQLEREPMGSYMYTDITSRPGAASGCSIEKQTRHGGAPGPALSRQGHSDADPHPPRSAQRSAERASEPATSDRRGLYIVAVRVAILNFSQPYRCERPPRRALCAPQRQRPRRCRRARRWRPGVQRLLAPHWEPGAALSLTGDKGAALQLPAAVSATAMPSSPSSQSS